MTITMLKQTEHSFNSVFNTVLKHFFSNSLTELKNFFKNSFVEQLNNNIKEPLIIAILQFKDKELLSFALKAGLNPNVQTPDGESALMRAAKLGDLIGVKLLLKHGADPLLQDKTSLTAEAYALRFKQYEAASLIGMARLLENINSGISKTSPMLDQNFTNSIEFVKVKNLFIMHKNEYYSKSKHNQPVYERVLGVLLNYAAIAKEQHLKQRNKNSITRAKYQDVFTSDDQKNDLSRVHSITRLATNEFSFYPEKQHGPLSVNQFKWLLRQLTLKLSSYPNNLHFLFASFPIRDKYGFDHNVSIYIECGDKFKITLVRKFFSSTSDLSYFGGDRIEFLRPVVPVVSLIHFLKMSLTLLPSIYTLIPSHKRTDLLMTFIHDCQQHAEFPLDNQFITKLKKLTRLNFANVKKLIAILRDYIKCLEAVYNEDFKRSLFMFYKASSQQTEIPIYGLEEYRFSHVIQSKTKGGSIFVTAVDICVDNEIGVAYNCFYKKYFNFISLNVIPTAVSHLISSFTIAPRLNNSLSPVVEQVDGNPLFTGVRLNGTKVLPQQCHSINNISIFGKPHWMVDNPSIKIGKLGIPGIEFINQLLEHLDYFKRLIKVNKDVSMRFSKIKLKYLLDVIDLAIKNTLIPKAVVDHINVPFIPLELINSNVILQILNILHKNLKKLCFKLDYPNQLIVKALIAIFEYEIKNNIFLINVENNDSQVSSGLIKKHSA